MPNKKNSQQAPEEAVDTHTLHFHFPLKLARASLLESPLPPPLFTNPPPCSPPPHHPLKPPPDHPSKLLKPDLLTLHHPLGLILLIPRHPHHHRPSNFLIIDTPPENLGHEALEIAAAKIQPPFQDGAGDLATGIADQEGDADADELVEAGHVGGEVGVEIVAVEGVPEVVVQGGFEQAVEVGEFVDRFRERGFRGEGHAVVAVGFRCRRGGGGVWGRGDGEGVGWGGGAQDGGREEVEAEGEVGGGELGEGFDEDGGDGVVAREVRVELVSERGVEEEESV